MTLDEAIERYEKACDPAFDDGEWTVIGSVGECRQLADWLTDLRMHRESEVVNDDAD